MSLRGPILLVENDDDDRKILTEIIERLELPNPLRLLSNGHEALDYLRTTTEAPFLILSDINMHVMDGLQLLRAIGEDEALRHKSIPFVFLTDFASEANVRMAYSLMVQGFYKKLPSVEETEKQVRLIIEYWQNCLHPSSHFSY